MLILGEAADDYGTEIIAADWDFDPDDPFAVSLEFIGYDAFWCLSLEQIREALADQWDIHGEGDVIIASSSTTMYIHLKARTGNVTIGFPVKDVRTFLSEVDDSDADEVVADAIDEFLEEIND